MKNILVSALVATVVSCVVFFSLNGRTGQDQASPATDPFLERVESSGEVRCGYVNNPPFTAIDPNTRAVSGIMVDITEKIGKTLGWKIAWSFETAYPVMAQDLEQGKFDVFCGGSWPVPHSEKRQWWLGPLFYSAVDAFARIDDGRFGSDFNLKDINSPAYKISVIDGVAVDRIRAMEFPEAAVVSLPNMSGYGEMILQVVSGKADVVLIERETAYRYMTKNPGKIKQIGNHPIRFYGLGYEFPFAAQRLRNTFEAASRELVDGGVVDHILKKYEDMPGMFYRVRPIGGP